MYQGMKFLIIQQFYNTAEDVKDRLDVIRAKKLLTEKEYDELTALTIEVYAATA